MPRRYDDDDEDDGYSSGPPRSRRHSYDDDADDESTRPPRSRRRSYDDDADDESTRPPRSRRRSNDDDDDRDDDYDDLPVRGRDRGGGDAASRVFAPALALMIIGAISFIAILFYCPINLYVLVNDPEHQAKPKNEQMEELVGAAVLVPLAGVANLVVVVCAFLMKSLTSYGASMTGAIIAVIPCCSPCLIFGIPFGIWALMVLNDPVVQKAFKSGR